MIKLYDYQREAINNASNGCIFCGGVGSGKSLTSLGYYYKFNGGTIEKDGSMARDMFHPQDLYIITTAHKRDTREWHQEILSIKLTTEENGYYKNKVIIDSWNNIEKYVDVSCAFFIFDEQRVVGYGKWTKSFLKITKKNNWLLLSATPGDTWSDYIPVFIANGFYRNKTDFNDQHVIWNPHTVYPCIDRYIGTKKLESFRDRILIDMRFNRPTIAHHEYINCPYNAILYKDVSKNRYIPYEKEIIDGVEFNKPIETASQFCSVLRRIVNSDPERVNIVKTITSRFDRVIIFYNFNYELDILRNIDYGPARVIAEWNGSKHEPIPDTNRWIYLVQYSAGAEGWNCILTNCMVFYSENYSYRMMEQASGRIDRLNTKYVDLYYYHIRSTSKIDLAIKRALENKKDFNQRAFFNKMFVNKE